MLKMAAIGCGNQSRGSIIPTIRPAGADLVATCDLDRGLAEDVARRHGADRVYTDYCEMLEKEDVQAVTVVGPPEMHIAVGIEVLKSGRHLFIEKPPGWTLEEARLLESAATDANRQVMVGFMKRHARPYQIVKEAIEKPEFGGANTMRMDFTHMPYPELRGDLGLFATHPIDLARFFMGDVTGGVLAKHRVHDLWTMALTLEHGSERTSVLTLSALGARANEFVDIVGKAAVIQVRGLTEVRYIEPKHVEWTDLSMARIWYPELTVPNWPNDSRVLQGYAGQMQHFVEAVANDRPVSPNIADGVETMRIVEAVVAAPEGLSQLTIPA